MFFLENWSIGFFPNQQTLLLSKGKVMKIKSRGVIFFQEIISHEKQTTVSQVQV